MAVTISNLSGVSAANVSLATDLSIRIKEDVITGKLRDGQKLTEQAICNQYQVSRTPVREALAKLEAEGLVEMIPNRGAFVLGISAQDMVDILTLRKIYEVQAATWAAQRITTKEQEDLKENFEFMEFYTMKKDIQKMLNINRYFHGLIYKASHNRMLAQLLSSYQGYVKHNPASLVKNPDYLHVVLEEHRRIYQALLDRDAEAAAAAMSAHMNHSAERHLR